MCSHIYIQISNHKPAAIFRLTTPLIRIGILLNVALEILALKEPTFMLCWLKILLGVIPLSLVTKRILTKVDEEKKCSGI